MKILKFALVLVLIFQSMAFAADSISVINSFAFNAAKIIAESNNNFFFSPHADLLITGSAKRLKAE